MTSSAAINAWSARWLDWVTGSLVDGFVALLIVCLIWLAAGRKLQPRLGAWLFALVLLKCALPLPVMVPVIREALPASWIYADEELSIFAASPPEALGAAHGMSASGGTVAPVQSPPSLASWLLLAWLAGITVAAARMGWLWTRTQRLVREARPVKVEDIVGLQALLKRTGGGRVSKLRVRVSQTLRSPAVTGWFRAVLLLPEGLEDRLSPEQYRWVLAHELAHVRAGDIAWQWVESLVKTVLFFHPVAWLASAQSARLRERACDEAAVQLSGTSRQSSAEGFVSLIEWAQRPVALVGLQLGSAGREARARVRALARGPLRQAGWRWQLSVGVLCAAAALPSFRPVPVQAQQGTTTKDQTRIAELEQRVADLERKLQAKSRLETLRENAVRRAHQRVEAESAKFTPDQLQEIERIYQDARKVTGTALRSAAYEPLFTRFPAANRTGCARILLANTMQLGPEREALLLKAAKDHSDAYFLDGTNVGGVARLSLAQDAHAAGRADDAKKWRNEIRQRFAEELDFGAVPLVDLLDVPAVRQ